jgi:hypothetical protein
VIKPSSSEVQEIARLTTDAIRRDIESLSTDAEYGIISQYDIIQLKIEQVLTETIRGFENELVKDQCGFWHGEKTWVEIPPTIDTRHYPEQSPE